MCGKYKDKEKYLEVSIGIVDDLTKMIVEILSISSFQEIKEKKEILKLKDEVNNILKNYEVLIKEKNITINNYLKDEEILKMLEENKENYIKKFPKYISFFDKVNFIFKRIEKNYSRIIKDDREILLFYSTLRNTIHNGGINRKETKKIEIKGKKIIIEKDKPAFYENYFDVLILIEEIIDIFIEIFEKL